VLKWFEGLGKGNLTELVEVCLFARGLSGWPRACRCWLPCMARACTCAWHYQPHATISPLICGPTRFRPCQIYMIRRPALLTADRLQPGEKPATAGDGPVTPWVSPPPPPRPPAPPARPPPPPSPQPPAPAPPSPQLASPSPQPFSPSPTPSLVGPPLTEGEVMPYTLAPPGQPAPPPLTTASAASAPASRVLQLLLACAAALTAAAWL
jgi:hypothetical protein